MACARCDDTGWRPVERDGVRRVERCECWQASFTKRALANARIPPQYARCDFENFQSYPNEKLLTAVARARKFAEEFPVVKKGLFLIGPPGIGKTHLAVAVLRGVIHRTRATALFYDVRELLKVIRSTYNPVVRTAEMDILHPVMRAELLILDDLGAERPSEWVEETLNLIVNTRYNERRPTIFTTNFEDSLEEGEVDALKERVGFRMHSRLHEMCDFLEYEGPDYRMLGVNGGSEDLAMLWKKGRGRRAMPSRTQGQARAQLREPKPVHELNWPGGKAGRG